MNYKNGRWAAKREAVLSRDKDRCRECQRYGIPMDASVVHHAYPADDFPEYAWCDWNLVSLCPGCHNAMHDRESGALTAKGMAWMRRVSPPSSGKSLSPWGTEEGRDISDGEENG